MVSSILAQKSFLFFKNQVPSTASIKNKSKILLKKYQKSLGFSRIYISSSKKMELVFTFWS